MKKESFGHSQQRGAVLLVSLIMLLLLTIIGTAAMRDTNLQERMAGNMRDHHLAFQAAEAALRFAEQGIKDEYENLINDSLYPVNEPSNAVVFNDFSGNVYSKPSYTITRLPHPGQLNMQDMVNPETAGGGSLEAGESLILDFVLVRIESTGTGMSSDSKVTLRSVYFVEE